MNLSLFGLVIALSAAFIGIPLGFSMLLTGFGGFALLRGLDAAMKMVSLQITGLVLNTSFAVLPLFILMGVFVARSRLSEDLYEASNAWFGHLRGGLAMSTIVACGGFAAISGSSLANSATMAKIAVPSMRKFNYADSLSTGAVAAGGTLGGLIPPSNALIVYGIITEQDIAKLFMAGIVPGVLSIGLYMASIAGTVRLWPQLGPPGIRTRWLDRFRSLGRTWGVLTLFLVIMAGIFFGVFTPSEAGGIGAGGALLFAIGRRRLSWREFVGSLLEAASTSAVLFALLFGALILNQFINIAGLPNALGSFVEGLSLSPHMVVIIILLIYIIMGTAIDGFSLIFLTAPIFAPIMYALGFDLIWFGIFMVMVAEISVITPPVGLNVFIVKSVLPEVQLNTIFRGIVPFFFADIVRVILIIVFPIIVLFLPSLMY